VGRELRITRRAYIRNYMALFEDIGREQASCGDRSQTVIGAPN
jgi:hypothetical protein